MFRSTLTAPRFLGIAALLFTLSLSTVASNLPTTDSKDREVSKYVNLKLQIWQDRMNLKDWDIQVEMVRSGQLEPKTLGNVHWDTDIKQAKIMVLASEDYKLPYKEMLEDWKSPWSTNWCTSNSLRSRAAMPAGAPKNTPCAR